MVSRGSKSLTWLVLFGLWCTFALSGIVFIEPAPFDVLMLGFIWLLPAMGLFAMPTLLRLLFALLFLICAGGLIASTQAIDIAQASKFTYVTIYLSAISVLVAGFIAVRPFEHTHLIFSAYTAAALIAAIAAFIGYFGILPTFSDSLTLFGRASGTFKDPNVFGPFLVPPILYAFSIFINGSSLKRPITTLGALIIMLILTFAVFVSFSRGAWLNLIVAFLVFGYLTFITTRTNRQKLKMLALAAFGLTAGLVILGTAVQSSSISDLLKERASIVQNYDQGPDGRFGGQIKALKVITEKPLGLGALEFSKHYHHEDVHNSYLSMFLKAGWIGGFSYLLLVLVTLILGLRFLLKSSKLRPLFIVLWASFFALALESLIVDTDHWRHFFVLLALIWGQLATHYSLVLVGKQKRFTQSPARPNWTPEPIGTR